MPQLTQPQIAHCKASLEQLKDNLRDQIEQSWQSSEVVNLDQSLIGRISRADAIQQQNVAITARNSATPKSR